ncbi:hypothetical protein MBLNU230_g4287t1 [Neophaeotheca triangularis]
MVQTPGGSLESRGEHESVDQLNDLSDEARKIRNEAIKIGSADIALLPLGMGRYPFVGDQEDMLDFLIEKAGLAEILPVAGQPVVEALQRLGFALDNYGSAVQDISDDLSTVTIESGRKLLASKVDQCVGSYSGIVE